AEGVEGRRHAHAAAAVARATGVVARQPGHGCAGGRAGAAGDREGTARDVRDRSPLGPAYSRGVGAGSVFVRAASRFIAVQGVAQRLLARIVLQVEIEPVHHVGVAEPGVGIPERERATRAGRAERARAGAEPDLGSRSQEAERNIAGYPDSSQRSRALARNDAPLTLVRWTPGVHPALPVAGGCLNRVWT